MPPSDDQMPAIPGSGVKSGKKHKSKGSSKKQKTAEEYKPTDKPAPPILPSLNLAVRPDLEAKSSTGVKLLKTKIAKPYHQSNINNESHLHFLIRSTRHEWIRFNPDCLSLVVYGVYNNPARNAAAAAGTIENAANHALRASEGLPQVYMDPSVMGTSFFSKVEVTINHVKVPTNGCLGELVLHYTRCCRIFNGKPGPALMTTRDVNFAGRAGLSRSMRVATEPFDYVAWNRGTGSRVPVFLDGHFPFDCKNKTLESIDKKSEPNMYFPPDTEIEIKFHLHRDKADALFNHAQNNVTDFADNAASYWSATPAAGGFPAGFALTFQDAQLEYESCELHAEGHERSLSLFKSGGIATYYYDIPRAQHQSLLPAQSFTENNFQILAFARLAYVLFVPDWAAYTMENMRRPLSALSRYPTNCSSLKIGFAGERSLIVDKFENFGVRGENTELSKKILYQYMTGLKAFSGTFEQLFPRYADDVSLVQGFVIDLKDYMSPNTEYLNVQCEFAGVGAGNGSPARTQIIVISVHPNGKATCEQAQNPFSYLWKFTQY